MKFYKEERVRNRIYIAFLILLLVPSASIFSASGPEKISPYLQLQYFKAGDNSSALQATLTYSKNRMEIPITGMKITFYAGDKNKNILATVVTDEKGVARLPVDPGKLPSNPDHSWSFSSGFDGNDTIESINSGISIKDVQLDVSASEADSTRILDLEAYRLEEGKRVPAAGEVVMVYVPRMFSLLPVAEATLDDNGSAKVEFPADIPGDRDGNLEIISRFEENASYGNVERKIITKWGVPTAYSIPKTHRALWTKTPPTWMIITLSVLLTGVWGHYLFAVISLILIKIDSKPKKPKIKKEPEIKIAR